MIKTREAGEDKIKYNLQKGSYNQPPPSNNKKSKGSKR